MMDAALNQKPFVLKIAAVLKDIKFPDFEQIFSDISDYTPIAHTLDYVGDLNKSDAML